MLRHLSSLGAFSWIRLTINLHSNRHFYITSEHHDYTKFVHMKKTISMSFFELNCKCVYHVYTLHTHHFSLNFGQHAQYSHNSEHTHINIIITKIHYIPNFYKQTYQTYYSMGASDKDMQRETTLVFE